MPIASRRPHLSLSARGREFLTSELEDIARSSPSSLRGRSDRVAVTFRPCKQGRDAIPDHPIDIDAFRLLAASSRWCLYPRRGPRWRVALGVYRATLDFPGSGRIVFRCEWAFDVTSPHSLIHPRPNYTAIRVAIVLHQAIRDADAGDLAVELRLPAFYFGFDPDRSPRFDTSVLPAARAAERAIDGLRAWPADLFSRDGKSTLFRAPQRVFASIADLKGRRIRNPAFATLRHHGLLPAGVGYNAWLTTVGRADGRGRVIQDPRAERTESARLRRGIEDYVVADPAREPIVLDDLREACHASGLKLAEGPQGIDELARILDNPWDRATVPYAARVQVLRLAGSPGSAPMSFSDGAADVDLFDLGPDRARFTPASPGPARR
jgi:hypothetical protein